MPLPIIMPDAFIPPLSKASSLPKSNSEDPGQPIECSNSQSLIKTDAQVTDMVSGVASDIATSDPIICQPRVYQIEHAEDAKHILEEAPSSDDDAVPYEPPSTLPPHLYEDENRRPPETAPRPKGHMRTDAFSMPPPLAMVSASSLAFRQGLGTVIDSIAEEPIDESLAGPSADLPQTPVGKGKNLVKQTECNTIHALADDATAGCALSTSSPDATAYTTASDVMTSSYNPQITARSLLSIERIPAADSERDLASPMTYANQTPDFLTDKPQEVSSSVDEIDEIILQGVAEIQRFDVMPHRRPIILGKAVQDPTPADTNAELSKGQHNSFPVLADSARYLEPIAQQQCITLEVPSQVQEIDPCMSVSTAECPSQVKKVDVSMSSPPSVEIQDVDTRAIAIQAAQEDTLISNEQDCIATNTAPAELSPTPQVPTLDGRSDHLEHTVDFLRYTAPATDVTPKSDVTGWRKDVSLSFTSRISGSFRRAVDRGKGFRQRVAAALKSGEYIAPSNDVLQRQPETTEENVTMPTMARRKIFQRGLVTTLFSPEHLDDNTEISRDRVGNTGKRVRLPLLPQSDSPLLASTTGKSVPLAAPIVQETGNRSPVEEEHESSNQCQRKRRIFKRLRSVPVKWQHDDDLQADRKAETPLRGSSTYSKVVQAISQKRSLGIRSTKGSAEYQHTTVDVEQTSSTPVPQAAGEPSKNASRQLSVEEETPAIIGSQRSCEASGQDPEANIACKYVVLR